MPRAQPRVLVVCECGQCRGLRRVSTNAQWLHMKKFGHMDDVQVVPEEEPEDPGIADDRARSSSEDDTPPDPANAVRHRPKPAFDPRDDYGSDSDDGENNELLVSRLCVELIGLVTENLVSQTGLMAVLEVMNRRLGYRMAINLPRTYHSVLKAAHFKPDEALSCVWPICDCLAYAFPPGESICKECGTRTLLVVLS